MVDGKRKNELKKEIGIWNEKIECTTGEKDDLGGS